MAAPAHLEIVEESRASAHLTVELVEQLGADSLIHGRLGDESGPAMTVRLQGIHAPGSGERLPLVAKPAHVHLFDPESGVRI